MVTFVHEDGRRVSLGITDTEVVLRIVDGDGEELERRRPESDPEAAASTTISGLVGDGFK